MSDINISPPVDDDEIDEDDDYTPEDLHVFLPSAAQTYSPFMPTITVIDRTDGELFETNMNDIIAVMEGYASANDIPQIEIDDIMYNIKTFVKSISLQDYDLSSNNINIFTSWHYNVGEATYNNTILIIFYVTADNNIIVTTMICADNTNIAKFAFNFITELYNKLPAIENIYLYNGAKQLIEGAPNALEEVPPTIALSISLPEDIPLILNPDPDYVFMKFKMTSPERPTALVRLLQNPNIELKYSVITPTSAPENRETIKRILLANFNMYGITNSLLYVASTPSMNDLIDNVMLPGNNVFLSHKTVRATVNGAPINNMYVMALLIYKITSTQLIVTHFITFYNPEGTNSHNNFINLYDVFKGVFDKYTWINNIYFYAANKQFVPFLTNAYIGWREIPSVAPLQRLLNIDMDNENFQVMFYARTKLYPVIHLNDADFVRLEMSPLTIPPDATVFDLIEGIDIPVHQYLKDDPQNIVFITTHNNTLFYLASNRDTIRDMLFKKIENTTTPDYSNIFYGCKKIVHSLEFTADDINHDILYFNMAKLGASGTYMVELFELLHTIVDEDHKAYMLDSTNNSLISIISVSSFCSIHPNLVSSAHCQSGQGGLVYRIKYAAVTEEANKRRRSKGG